MTRSVRAASDWAGLACLCLLTLLAAGCNSKPAPLPQVTIAGHSWNVELAVTPQQREHGLGGRTSLPSGQGMLFIFEEPRKLEFWMRGCRMSLDIAFVDARGRVISVQTMYQEPNKTENELTTYSSGSAALYALETTAGELRQAGIKPGDTVTFSPDIPLPSAGMPTSQSQPTN